MTTTETPGRTLEQRLAALEQANRNRFARADLKRAAKADPMAAYSAIVLPAPEYRQMRLRDLLLALHGVAETKVDRWMHREMIGRSKRIGGLSARQRLAAEGFVATVLDRRRAAL